MGRRSRDSDHKSYKKSKKSKATKPSPGKKVIIVPGQTRQFGYMVTAPGFSGKKFVDTNVGSTGPSTTGTIISGGSLCEIPQGITKNTRLGNDCIITNLNIHGRISLLNVNVSAVAPLLPVVFAQDRLRVIVYIDTQTNGSPATALDILAVQPGGGTASIDSFRNYNNLSRFRILKDKVYAINASAAGALTDGTNHIFVGSGSSRELRLGFKLNLSMYFDDVTGLIGTMTTNNLGMLCFTDNQQAQIEFIARVKYVDPQ